jgi:hypothetical protein
MRKRRAVIVVCAYRAKVVAVLGIFPGLIAERISSEAPWCSALTIDDGNVGLNVPLQKPPQKLPLPYALSAARLCGRNSEMVAACRSRLYPTREGGSADLTSKLDPWRREVHAGESGIVCKRY